MASSYLPSRASPRPMLATPRAPSSAAAIMHATDTSRIATDFIDSILQPLFLPYYLERSDRIETDACSLRRFNPGVSVTRHDVPAGRRRRPPRVRRH